jgi:hypothetical protein
MNAPLTQRDIRARILGAEQAAEKLTVQLEGYKKLPIEHGNLMEKIHNLARIIFFLKTNVRGKYNEASMNKEKSVLEDDLHRISDGLA